MKTRRFKNIITAVFASVIVFTAAAGIVCAAESFTDEKSAVEYVRLQMKDREPEIIFELNTKEDDLDDLMGRIFDAAMEPTGKPDEGDYIRFHYEENKASCTKLGDNAEITYKISYISTKAEEEMVDIEVSSILEDLDMQHDPEFVKIMKIDKYLSDNTEYDKKGLKNGTEKHSAYSALISKKTVCQGYALAMYRLLLESGVDARIVSGTGYPSSGKPAAHSWIMAKVGEEYYYIDPTWNDSRQSKWFKLYGSNSNSFMDSHKCDDMYKNADFTEKYPVAEDNLYDSDMYSKKNLILFYMDNAIQKLRDLADEGKRILKEKMEELDADFAY